MQYRNTPRSSLSGCMNGKLHLLGMEKLEGVRPDPAAAITQAADLHYPSYAPSLALCKSPGGLIVRVEVPRIFSLMLPFLHACSSAVTPFFKHFVIDDLICRQAFRQSHCYCRPEKANIREGGAKSPNTHLGDIALKQGSIGILGIPVNIRATGATSRYLI